MIGKLYLPTSDDVLLFFFIHSKVSHFFRMLPCILASAMMRLIMGDAPNIILRLLIYVSLLMMWTIYQQTLIVHMLSRAPSNDVGICLLAISARKSGAWLSW